MYLQAAAVVAQDCAVRAQCGVLPHRVLAANARKLYKQITKKKTDFLYLILNSQKQDLC